MSKLVIIESPGKIKALKNYLGAGYKVTASMGHVRDLPKSSLGVDIEHGFAANYVNMREKSDLLISLRKEAQAADTVYLATDPDREGEAISWHLLSVIDCPEDKIKRVTFNEITKSAVKAGIGSPRGIDMDLVNSQQARRILDRIVGYKLSPFLWHTVRKGLSAGRVQSVATRIVVDRENEIRNFVPEEYWKLEAQLENSEGKPFTAHFHGINGKKTDVRTKEEADEIYEGSLKGTFKVASVKKSTKTRTPAPPFTTSTLLQDASRKLNFPSAKTMKIAQALYEGVDLGPERGGSQGLITYMRTDSVRISAEALSSIRELIKNEYGEKYLPEKPRYFKTKDSAQDAHEAIRPSHAENKPADIKDKLTSDQYKLYKLIWERFTASQMEAAVYDAVSADITSGIYDYRASGSTLKFKGFLALYEEGTDGREEKEARLPQLSDDEELTLIKLDREQKFTEPPPRYTEAALIKAMEELGIGRPSTIPPTITTILERGYVSKDGKNLAATELGEVTVDMMKQYFPDIIDYKFTAGMETRLDGIAQGSESMNDVLSEFWGKFSKDLAIAESKAENVHFVEQTDIICDKCGAKMVIKSGRYGKFAACPNYPSCKNTVKLDKNGKPVKKAEKEAPKMTDMKCELCGGNMVIRKGRYGEFYSCENFPVCKNTKPIEAVGAECPVCGKSLAKKLYRKTTFWSCSGYPKCKFSTSNTPTEEKCEKCGKTLFRDKTGKNVCLNKECENYKGK